MKKLVSYTNTYPQKNGKRRDRGRSGVCAIALDLLCHVFGECSWRLEGRNPFGVLTAQAAMKSICLNPSPSLSSSAYSSDFVDFVKQCLVKEQEQRPSVAELLTVGLSGLSHTQHPFIVDAVRAITQNGVSPVLAGIVGAPLTPNPTPTMPPNLFPLTTVINAGSTPSSGAHGSSGKGVLLIRDEGDFHSMQKGIHTILTEANVCNKGSITTWSFTSYPQLRELSVGPQSFRCVGSLRLGGMMQLKKVEIGEGSFTMCTTIPATSTNNAFIITNCPKLKTITIASNAFMDWGEFQLKSDD